MTSEVYSIRHSKVFYTSVMSSNQKQALNTLVQIERNRQSVNVFRTNFLPTRGSVAIEMEENERPKSAEKYVA